MSDFEAALAFLESQQGGAPQSPWNNVPAPSDGSGLRRRSPMPVGAYDTPQPAAPGAGMPEPAALRWGNVGSQVGSMLLGVGSGLLSTRPGTETWGQGLGRGLQAGTQGALAEGRRQRAEAARKHFSERADAAAGTPDEDLYRLMGHLEPGQAAQLYGQTAASGNADRRQLRSIVASDERYERSESDRRERQQIGLAESRSRAARSAGRGRSAAIDDAGDIMRARAGNQESIDRLQAAYPTVDWSNVTVEEPIPDALNRLEAQATEMIRWKYPDEMDPSFIPGQDPDTNPAAGGFFE